MNHYNSNLLIFCFKNIFYCRIQNPLQVKIQVNNILKPTFEDTNYKRIMRYYNFKTFRRINTGFQDNS